MNPEKFSPAQPNTPEERIAQAMAELSVEKIWNEVFGERLNKKIKKEKKMNIEDAKKVIKQVLDGDRGVPVTLVGATGLGKTTAVNEVARSCIQKQWLSARAMTNLINMTRDQRTMLSKLDSFLSPYTLMPIKARNTRQAEGSMRSWRRRSRTVQQSLLARLARNKRRLIMVIYTEFEGGGGGNDTFLDGDGWGEGYDGQGNGNDHLFGLSRAWVDVNRQTEPEQERYTVIYNNH